MTSSFTFHALFVLLATVMTTQGFPLRHVSQALKDKSVFREKRTPVLCWVVQIHVGFKCQSLTNTAHAQLSKLSQHHDVNGLIDNGQENEKLNGVGNTGCTKHHYNELAKELHLVVVHVFSNFPNHVLMCFQDENQKGVRPSLSTIHHLHPDLLHANNTAKFLIHKNIVERNLLSHGEVVTFHAESTHHRWSRTNGNVPQTKDKIAKSKVQNDQYLPFRRREKDTRHLNLSSFSDMSQDNSNHTLSMALKALLSLLYNNEDNDTNFSLLFKYKCHSHSHIKRFWCDIVLPLSIAFQEKPFTKITHNDNNIQDAVLSLENVLRSSRLKNCLKMFFNELDSFLNGNDNCSGCNAYFTDETRSILAEVIHQLLNYSSSSVLKHENIINAMSSKPTRDLLEHAHSVINSFFKILHNNETVTKLLQSSFNFDLCHQPTRGSSSFLSGSGGDHHKLRVLHFNLQDSSTHRRQVNRRLSVPLSQSSKSSSSSLSLKSSSSSSSSSLYKPNLRKRRRSSSSSSSFISFNDPAYPHQWHLHNLATPSMDINVTGVWAKGYTGSGVTVAVVDDGLQWRNDDLKANYNYRGSWDFNDDDPDPTPSTKKKANHHGTRCAGEIAAVANNRLCGVGVAYGANIAGIRVLDGVMTDSLEAEAFNKGMEINDVYSCSWGPEDDGKTVDGPHLMAARAMRHGIEFGRHGYGSIYVVASGNGGLNKDNCNFDGYANSIYTVTIGAVDESGVMPYYSEECASMLGVTFSSGTRNKRDIVTTDWTYHNPSGCTEGHTGTSAAAPLAAGLIALMLQARPCLTWRDVQYIIILTAKKVDVDIAHWQQNGAGLSHSHKHGFGLLSSWRMVNAARVWKYVPWMTSYSQTNDLEDLQLYIPKGGNSKNNRMSLIVWDMVKEEDIRGYGLFTLESVQVTVWLSHPYRGKLSVKLISPSKTVSVIAAPRPNDNSSLGFQDWTFTTVRCWGESPVGNWSLVILDTDYSKYGKGRLTKWRLTLFGTPMSRSEFDERRSLVESAMSGQYLDVSSNMSCPPPPQKTEVVETVSDKTLKILILCGVFCLVMAIYETFKYMCCYILILCGVFCLIMAIYETFEYMCCYGDEKKEYQQEVEQMRTAQRMTDQTLRALEADHHQSAIPMTPISSSSTRDIRTINNLNSMSLSSRSSRRNGRSSYNYNGGERNRIEINDNGRNIDNNDDDDHDDDDDADEEDEEDLWDASETSGLLRLGTSLNDSSSDNNGNIRDNHHHRIHHSSPSSSSNSSKLLHKSQSKINSITHSIKNKLGNLSAFVRGGGGGIPTHAIHHPNDSDNDSCGENSALNARHNLSDDYYDNDDDEDELFDASLSALENAELSTSSHK